MPIEHVFVLMMENRSFDHVLGSSKIQGVDPSGRPTSIDGLTGDESNLSPKGETVKVSYPAEFISNKGPGHEFKDVREQLCGKDGAYSSPAPPPGQYDPNINNGGYIENFARYEHKHPETIMKCFTPSQLPVLTTLAKEFVLCDRWFSSLPGPTWPNRFFVHAASSGGLDDSPSFSREFKSVIHDGFRFENGTIFDRLDEGKQDWAIYSDDEFPQALSIAGMRKKFDSHFSPFTAFAQDVGDPSFSKAYVFIEPDYHAFTGKFRGGNSQHPMDDVTSGERFVKSVYESIRSSPHWEKSLLIITYDEHGGFYDHVIPPAAVAPGDSDMPGNNHNGFDFRQLGVRVPTVIVSPLVAKGTIDHTTYDHTSVLATVEKLLGLGSLTKRDAAAQTLNHLFEGHSSRSDTPRTLPEPAFSGYVHKEGEEDKGVQGLIAKLISLFGGEEVDPSLRGFHHVALLRDMEASPESEKEEIVGRFLRHRQYHATRYMRRIRKELGRQKQGPAVSARSS